MRRPRRRATTCRHGRTRCRLCPDVDRPSEILDRKPARRDPQICRRTRPDHPARLRRLRPIGLRMDGREALQQLIQEVKSGRPISRSSSSMTSAGGAGFRMPMKAPITNTSAAAPACGSNIAPSNSKMTAARFHHRQERQARHGRRIQPRAVRQGLHRAVPPDRTRLSTGRRRRVMAFAVSCIDERGEVKGELKRGEHKSLQTDRVILVPGPEDEERASAGSTAVPRRRPVGNAKSRHELNDRGILTDLGRAWTRATVHQILTNEKYIGNNVYNRRSFKLKQQAGRQWPARCGSGRRGPSRPSSSRNSFRRCRRSSPPATAGSRTRRCWIALTRLLQRHGYLSGLVIDEADGMPSSGAYAQSLRQPDPGLLARRLSPRTGTTTTSK